MRLLQFRKNLGYIFPTLKYNFTALFPAWLQNYVEIELFARVAPFKSIMWRINRSWWAQFRKTLRIVWNCRNCHFTHLTHISTIMSIYPQLHMPALISLQCHAKPRYHAIIITRRLWPLTAMFHVWLIHRNERMFIQVWKSPNATRELCGFTTVRKGYRDTTSNVQISPMSKP